VAVFIRSGPVVVRLTLTVDLGGAEEVRGSFLAQLVTKEVDTSRRASVRRRKQRTEVADRICNLQLN
jgi:hypothetical protein